MDNDIKKAELIKCIDSLIIESGQVRSETCKLLEKFAKNILLYIDYKIIDEDSDSVELLFSQSIGANHRRFIAISFLRLISTNKMIMEESNLKIKLFNLFDSALEDIYKKINIVKKNQTYEKQQILEGIVPKIENELSQQIGSITSLISIHNFRNGLLREFSNPLKKAILIYYLPKGFIENRINEILAITEDYHNSDIRELYHKYDRAISLINLFISDSLEFGTFYSIQFLVKLGQQLSRVVNEHFLSSPLCKSAELCITKSIKTYPLTNKFQKFNISIIINNNGTGYAYDVSLDIESDKFVKIIDPTIFLGTIENNNIVIQIPIEILQEGIESICLNFSMKWRDFDKKINQTEELLEFFGQKNNFDWKMLENEDPYSLEAVDNEDELFGRKEIISQLLAQAKNKNMGSSFIHGQKRVGKTSVVKTLKKIIEKLYPKEFNVIYLERGEFQTENEIGTLRNLATRITEEIMRYTNIKIKPPDYYDVNSPIIKLAEFISSLIDENPKRKILMILDEFDELPNKLYKRGPTGDAFFSTIRSLSGKSNLSFILVGSENMRHILDFQGYALNKFRVITLNYFDRKEHWYDFQELIRKPVSNWFIISDDAIITIYELTAGNPFFTKLVCSSLFKVMVNRRDSHITSQDVKESISYIIKFELASNKFQHFWTDGIFETSIRFEEKTIRRRKTLLAIAEIIRHQNNVNKDQIISKCIEMYGLQEEIIEGEIQEFIQREILVPFESGLKFKVPLFSEWLVEKGIDQIITTFSDMDEYLKRKKKEEDNRIKSQEIVDLVDSWSVYKGIKITEDRVRIWLEQFGDNFNQRLIFDLIKGLKFYSNSIIRTKMREIYGIITRNITINFSGRKVNNILISYIDGPGKSGAAYAKLFADENKIYSDYVIAKNSILEKITNSQNCDALIFVDDFIGTGDSASNYFNKINEEIWKTVRKKNIGVFFLTICGFQEGKNNLYKLISSNKLPIEIYICDEFDETQKVFSDCSKLIIDERVRNKIFNICFPLGSQLVKENPLGYGDTQALVVFENSCPNNCLPILWATSKDWIPLFRRD
jgi:hypothetical protein